MLTFTLENASGALRAVVPIVKVATDGKPKLVGTGFFISNTGVLVTARHVVLDNIGSDGKDIGAIGVLQMWGPAAGTYRPLRFSSWHANADIAVCEVSQLRSSAAGQYVDHTLAVSLTPEKTGEVLSSQFYCEHLPPVDREISTEQTNPLARWRLSVDLALRDGSEAVSPSIPFEIGARITHGNLLEHYPYGRDTVMLPFPVYGSTLPIYAGASGGPVFNTQGQVIAINCTRVEGSDVSFHTTLAPLLDFSLERTVTASDPTPRKWSFRDLIEQGFLSIERM